MLKETRQRPARPTALVDELPSTAAMTRAARPLSAPSLVVHYPANRAARISERAIRGQLERILASHTFHQVDRLRRFISFIVCEGAAGRGGNLKEYVIGVHVFDKPSSFDPRTDTIVRVQARRLRARLAHYYLEEGQHDDVVIELPKGGYAPTFQRREAVAQPRSSLSAAPASPNTIAVSAFADRSAGATLDRFCRGLRDEIVHALTSLGRLRVVTASDDIAGVSERSMRTDAAFIISGSVRDAGDHVRVTTQLLDGASHCYLWSEAIDAALADPIATQEAIARTVMARLEPEFGSGASGVSAPHATESLTARNLYRQGRHYLDQRTEDGIRKAVDFFEKALLEDTGYALAHSGLADAYRLLAHYGVLAPTEVWSKAASSAATAVMLDGLCAEAHTSLAHVRATQDWDWAAAEHHYQRAIHLDPRYATPHHWRAMTCLVPMGRLDTAFQEMRLAQSLDPVSSIIARDVAVILSYRRDFDAALEQCKHAIELNPHYLPAYLTLGSIREHLEDFEASEAAFRHAGDLAPRSPRPRAALARTFALSGKRQRARDIVARLEEQARTQYVSPFEFATIHLGLGDAEQGYRWLRRACDDRCFELLALKVDPRFDALHDDPCFGTAVRHVGLV